MKQLFPLNPRVRSVVLHLIAWTTIGSLLLFSHPPISEFGPLVRFQQELTWLQFMSLTTLVLLFYVNTCFLIPMFFQRGKKLAFWVVQVVLGVLFILIENGCFDYVCQKIHFSSALLSMPFGAVGRNDLAKVPVLRLPLGILILPILLTIAASLAYRYIADSLKESDKRKEQQMANLTSELQLLKSQVSPHFLFNVLNGLAFLSRRKSASLEPALIKLSSLMRYMLYDADGSKVLLEKEVSYLKDYIDLQKMRYQELRVNLSFLYDDGEQLLIAPMLLIPFVENAFKHTAGSVEEHGFIKIDLSVKQNKLYFSVMNKFTSGNRGEMDKASGIGLSNVSKRLQLIYPMAHVLDIERIDDVFSVSLTVGLEMTMHG